MISRILNAATHVRAVAVGLAVLAAGPAIAQDPSDGLLKDNPTNVILDVDGCTDIDDGMALAIVHALQDRHEAKLLAVTVTQKNQECGEYFEALNTFYGQPDLPVGITRTGLSRTESRAKESAGFGIHTIGEEDFVEYVLNKKNPDGTSVFPHRPHGASPIPEAVALLRKTLATSADGSIVMIQVGLSTNLAGLLDSHPDEVSELDGVELVRKKVRLLSVMGGVFGESPPKNNGVNFYQDISSAHKIFDAWPTRIVVSGGEIGGRGTIPFPGISIERDYSYVAHHPIAEAYRHSCSTFLKINYPEWTKKCPHDHHTLDPTAALYALRPDRNYFSLSANGEISVMSDGSARFEPDQNGRHNYLVVSEEQKVRAQEAMMLLVSQPPKDR